MLAEALEHLVRGIVDSPDDVAVRSRNTRRGELLEVRVNPEDLGRVIGRNGRTHVFTPEGRHHTSFHTSRRNRQKRVQSGKWLQITST